MHGLQTIQAVNNRNNFRHQAREAAVGGKYVLACYDNSKHPDTLLTFDSEYDLIAARNAAQGPTEAYRPGGRQVA